MFSARSKGTVVTKFLPMLDSKKNDLDLIAITKARPSNTSKNDKCNSCLYFIKV